MLRNASSPFHTLLTLALLAASLTCAASVAWADTLRVATYNALNFRGEADSDRIDDFRTVLRAAAPDVVAMQEIISEDAVDVLLSFVFLPIDGDWASAVFHNGPDTNNSLFYRTSKVALVSQREIATELRNISEYVLRPASGDTAVRLRLYSLHLKASQGSSNEERRRQEAATLRQQLDLLPAGSLFAAMGDYNLYTSDEPAYQLLLSSDSDPDGQLFDPINRPGEWHANIAFADIHTQSAQAWMDDRFDFILVSAALMDTAGSYVLPQSYWAFGNDGLHYGRAINDGTNQAVPDSVADALATASDHLPVTVDVVIRSGESGVVERPQTPVAHGLARCYPNPFNPVLNVELTLNGRPALLEVYDALGRCIALRDYPSGLVNRLERLDFSTRATGRYFLRLSSGALTEVHSVNLVR